MDVVDNNIDTVDNNMVTIDNDMDTIDNDKSTYFWELSAPATALFIQEYHLGQGLLQWMYPHFFILNLSCTI